MKQKKLKNYINKKIMTKEELKQVSKHIAIYINDEKINTTLKELNNIFDYISIFDKYEMQTIEIEEQMTAGTNRWREDETIPSFTLKEALFNASRKNENFFKVPKVIE